MQVLLDLPMQVLLDGYAVGDARVNPSACKRVANFLRGRTPTEALADGDDQLVRDLVAQWYAATDAAALRLKSAPRVRIAAPRARQTV